MLSSIRLTGEKQTNQTYITAASRAARCSCQRTKGFAAMVWTSRGLFEGFREVLLRWKLRELLTALTLRPMGTRSVSNRSDGVSRIENSLASFFFFSIEGGQVGLRLKKCRCSAPEKRRAKVPNIRDVLCGAQLPPSAPPFDIHEVSCSQTRVRELTLLLSRSVAAHNLCLDRCLNKLGRRYFFLRR